MEQITPSERLVFVSAQMPEQLAIELGRIAKKHGRSRSSEVRMALTSHVAAEQAAEAAEAQEAAA